MRSGERNRGADTAGLFQEIFWKGKLRGRTKATFSINSFQFCCERILYGRISTMHFSSLFCDDVSQKIGSSICITAWCAVISIHLMSKACTSCICDMIRNPRNISDERILFIVLPFWYIEYLHKFTDEFFFLLLIIWAELMGCTWIQMSFEYERIGASEKAESRIGLLCNIHTISIFFDHFLNGIHKTFCFFYIREKFFFIWTYHSFEWKNNLYLRYSIWFLKWSQIYLISSSMSRIVVMIFRAVSISPATSG